MPPVLENSSTSVLQKTSGADLYSDAASPLPREIVYRQVKLRDRVTSATLVPFSSPDQLPVSLLNHLCALLNKVIDDGDSYPQTEHFDATSFGQHWFANFGAVAFLGDHVTVDEMLQSHGNIVNWEKICLGTFYIKPNYPGRSSHVCNGGFLTSPIARNRGVGRLMGESYLDWAPKLGYTYSVFNLVYETNVASCKIWDGLGFKRIGRVKGCGNLRSYPNQLVDAIIFGRELGDEEINYSTEDRFDKIRYYLSEGKYPQGSDRAEKSRLRSAATHYKLIPAWNNEPEKLMLKDKEVISDNSKQYNIARSVHLEHHAGINKSTAIIAEKYHWVGIKGTVSQAIRDCNECREISRGTSTRADEDPRKINASVGIQPRNSSHEDVFSESHSPMTSHATSSYAYSENMMVDPSLVQDGGEYLEATPYSGLQVNAVEKNSDTSSQRKVPENQALPRSTLDISTDSFARMECYKAQASSNHTSSDIFQESYDAVHVKDPANILGNTDFASSIQVKRDDISHSDDRH